MLILIGEVHAQGLAGWVIEVVDGTKGYCEDTSLALDAGGYPHIAFWREHLRYTWRDGEGWHTETVDGGTDASLALNTAGRPHISYCQGRQGNRGCTGLKYAWYDGASWHLETVDAQGDVGAGSSLALDTTDAPHISYQGDQGLKYAWYDGSSWQIQTVDGTGGVHTSLALDTTGRPHISYGTGNDLKYAWYDGSAWKIETVDGEGTSGFYTSLALDTAGWPHIACCRSYDSGACDILVYASYNGSSWQIETVEKMFGTSASLALDAAGRPHIAAEGSGNLRYVWRDSAGWHREGIGRTSGAGYSLALDAAGRPHISYCNDLGLVYARRATGMPLPETGIPPAFPWLWLVVLALSGLGLALRWWAKQRGV